LVVHPYKFDHHRVGLFGGSDRIEALNAALKGGFLPPLLWMK